MKSLERFWLWAGNNPALVTSYFLIIGIALALFSGILQLHSVTFDGSVAGLDIPGLRAGVTKQVGFMLAPNWGISGVIFLPAAVFYLLQARGQMELLL